MTGMTKTIFLVPLVISVLAGCATDPVPTSLARPAPESRIHDKSAAIPRPDYGQVTVKRDSGITGSGCNIQVFLNGNLSAELAPSEKVNFYLPEGTHIVSAWPNNPCGGGMTEVEAKATASKPITFRIGYGGPGDFGIYPTAF